MTGAGRRPGVLMLVATSVATDTRVLREATALVADGWDVHVVGRSVPEGWDPPEGVTVSSIGTSSVFRREGGASLQARGGLPWPVRFARWVMLPTHRNSALGRWAEGAVEDGRGRTYDVVHAHDFTALAAGRELADLRDVPLVYDSHEFWSGRPREYRPTPLQDRRELARERALGASAAAVITVGDRIGQTLRDTFGWDHVHVVRNTFEPSTGSAPAEPTGALYAGRLASHRELEVVAAASRRTDLPLTLIGPADETWLAGFDPGRAEVRSPVAADEVTTMLQQQGIALVTHDDAFPNLRLAMPNKAFQAVAAGVPVVATDVGALGELVREHELGTLYAPGDVEGFLAALDRVREEYPLWCRRVEQARPMLGWATDAEVLRGAYRELRPGAADGSTR